jgi:hypothetical protein
LFVAFGVVTDQGFRWLNSRLQVEDEGLASVGVAYGVFAVLGALVVVPVVLAILRGGQGTCGCETPVWASWSFVLVCVSTIVIWVDAISRLPSWATRIAATTGYLGVSGIVAFGLLRALSDATDIIG